MDWSTRSVVDLMEMIRMSAGTLSPTGVHTDRNRLSYSATLPDPHQPESSAPGGGGCVRPLGTGRSIDWF